MPGADSGEENAPTVVLSGQIDFRNVEDTRKAMLDALGRSKHVIGDVEFMDSSGLSALIDAAKQAERIGGRIELRQPSRRLRHMLDVTGFSALFSIESRAAPPPSSRTGVLEKPFSAEMSFLLPCRPATLATVRSRVAGFARRLPFTSEEIGDIQLAVGEAVSNAFRHGCPEGERGVIAVKCRISEDGVEVDIKDRGRGFNPEEVPHPEPGNLIPGGRGIFFMRILMDEVDFTFDHGTTVHLHKKLRTADEG